MDVVGGKGCATVLAIRKHYIPWALPTLKMFPQILCSSQKKPYISETKMVLEHK